MREVVVIFHLSLVLVLEYLPNRTQILKVFVITIRHHITQAVTVLKLTICRN